MASRHCYAMDVPRGALLVEYAVVIADVRVLSSHGSVHLTGADGALYRFAMSDRILIDEDTPEYQARIAAARALWRWRMTTKTQRREEAVSRLDELKHEDWPRFSLDHIGGEVEPGTAGRALLLAAETPENVPVINSYLKHFVPGECPSCGYGRFSWGIIHGTGSCACGWPGTLYHFVDLSDGSRLRFDALLWAHPYEVSTRA